MSSLSAGSLRSYIVFLIGYSHKYICLNVREIPTPYLSTIILKICISVNISVKYAGVTDVAIIFVV